jgi:hypothetical protein
MSGVSNKGPVTGAYGIGKVVLTFTPVEQYRKRRKGRIVPKWLSLAIFLLLFVMVLYSYFTSPSKEGFNYILL